MTEIRVWKVLFRSVNLTLPQRKGKMIVFLILHWLVTFFPPRKDDFYWTVSKL